MNRISSHGHFAALDVENAVICVSYPRPLWGANHGHFGALNSQNSVKTTATLGRKPIASKNPIDKPIVVHRNLWIIEAEGKADTPSGVTFSKAGLRQQKQKQKSRRGGMGRPLLVAGRDRAEWWSGEAGSVSGRGRTGAIVLGPFRRSFCRSLTDLKDGRE
jgi:hypothetical protein